MGFQRVKEILDQAVAAWALGHQHSADLTGHGPSFSWKTKADLLAAVGHGRRLIQPEVIGNGGGSRANLVVVLRVGLSWQMPKGGPYVPDGQIQEIEQWIDGGCQD